MTNDQIGVQIVMDIVYDDEGVQGFDSTFVNLSDQIGQEFKTVIGYKNYRAFANLDYDNGKGLVQIYKWTGSTGERLALWTGDEEK